MDVTLDPLVGVDDDRSVGWVVAAGSCLKSISRMGISLSVLVIDV